MTAGNCIPLRRDRGFTYVWAMATVAIVGIGLAAVGNLWTEEQRRERELDLVRIGRAYARAIESYRELSPGSVKKAPRELQALVLDDRFPRPQRHLRRLYPDPIDPARPWGVVRDEEGRILGVYSLSNQPPLRRVVFEVAGIVLPAADRYSEWKFMARNTP